MTEPTKDKVASRPAGGPEPGWIPVILMLATLGFIPGVFFLAGYLFVHFMGWI